MRHRTLSAVVVVSMAAVLVAGSAGTALADIKLSGFNVSPTSTTAGTHQAFTLTLTSSDGSADTTPQSKQKPLCLVFTAPGFGTFDAFGLSASPISVTGWPGASGPGANQFKLVAPSSSGPAIPGKDTVTVGVSATAPSAGSFTWSVVGYDNTGCSTNASATLKASTAVTVNPAPPPAKDNTQTTVSCDPAAPIVGTGSTCTATVTDTSTNTHPTGSISWSASLTSGSFSSTSCGLANAAAANASSCPVNYTPTSIDTRTITAIYVPSGNFNASSGTFAMTPQAQPAPPGRFQPDALIRRAVRGTSFIGNNIYNGNAVRQRVHSATHRRHTVAAVVEIQNDGNSVDNIVVGGTGGQAGYRVKYFFRNTSIRRQVTGHGYTFRLAPGATRFVQVLVTALQHDEIGKERTWQIVARSTADPLRRDAVKFTVTVV